MPIFVSSSFEDLKHRVYMALGRSPGSRVSRAAAVLSKHQKDDAEGGQPSVFIIGLGLSIPDHTTMEAYRAMAECRRNCRYFDLCGGGAPSNKYFGNGSFVSDETLYCRSSIRVPIDIVLTSLENSRAPLQRAV